MKSNKGITLVALVITIIVLLILAGVSISLVVGDNGVLTQAQSASKKTDVASVDSALQVALSGLSAEFMGTEMQNNANSTFSGWLTLNMLNTELGKGGYKIVSPTLADTAVGGNNVDLNIQEKNAATTDTKYSVTIKAGNYSAEIITATAIVE